MSLCLDVIYASMWSLKYLAFFLIWQTHLKSKHVWFSFRVSCCPNGTRTAPPAPVLNRCQVHVMSTWWAVHIYKPHLVQHLPPQMSNMPLANLVIYLIWKVLKKVQILKLHRGNKQDYGINRTGERASSGLQQQKRQQVEKCFSFMMEGLVFTNLIFSAGIAEERQLVMQKNSILPQMAACWSWNSSISPHNSLTRWALVAFSEI